MMREVIARAICSASQGTWHRGSYLNNHWRYKAQAALDAISEAGFAIVPKEPSDAMVGAGYMVAEQKPDETVTAPYRRIYRAMIEASQEGE